MPTTHRPEYPFTSHYLVLNDARLHYCDEGQGPVIVFVHGTPTWSYDFHHLIRHLSTRYRCIALDHIGFGKSDKPESYSYTLAQHTTNLKYLMDFLQLTDITLVAHDFGGPISMPLVLEQPYRFKRLFLMNTWLWSSEGDPEFEKLKRVLRSPILPFLYRWMNFSARVLLPSSFGKTKLDNAEHRMYMQQFPNRKSRNGTLGFARALLQEQALFDSFWQARATLAPLLMHVVWGMADPVLKSHLVDKFRTGFPHTTIQELEGVGHFPMIEAPEHVLDALRSCMETSD